MCWKSPPTPFSGSSSPALNCYLKISFKEVEEFQSILHVDPVLKSANVPHLDVDGVQHISPYNQEVQRHCKQMLSLGFLPPVRLLQTDSQQFFAEALSDIKAGTLLCEFAGEVCRWRDLLLIDESASLMELLSTQSSYTSLVLWPGRFANFSRFVNGVNNTDGSKSLKQNLNTYRCVIDNQIKVLVYVLKNVKKGNILYLDYNAGGTDQ